MCILLINAHYKDPRTALCGPPSCSSFLIFSIRCDRVWSTCFVFSCYGEMFLVIRLMMRSLNNATSQWAHIKMCVVTSLGGHSDALLFPCLTLLTRSILSLCNQQTNQRWAFFFVWDAVRTFRLPAAIFSVVVLSSFQHSSGLDWDELQQLFFVAILSKQKKKKCFP